MPRERVIHGVLRQKIACDQSKGMASGLAYTSLPKIYKITCQRCIKAINREMARRPQWTVHYTILSEDSDWVGEGWEFFNDEESATKCFDRLSKTGFHTPTKRPYYDKTDKQYLGACHNDRLNWIPLKEKKR